MNSRTYWNQYVQENGGAVGVAAKLGIPYPTIACICNGSRGIGRVTAQRMVDADPSLDKSILIWVTPFNQNSRSARIWPELAAMNNGPSPSPSSSFPVHSGSEGFCVPMDANAQVGGAVCVR